ncbi:hypothetical protein [Phaeobacter sp. C3_T13_0]|uniref:hypothetical protein n=1 Tax=Phaeobacter cretensis TaxID=3342641 RepID=UPI0039BD7922
MQSPAQFEIRPEMPENRAAPAGAVDAIRQAVPALAMMTAAAVIAGCTRVPELEDHLTPDLRNAQYPALVPLEDALEASTLPAEESKALENTLEARAARLQARADALRAAQP